MNEAVSADAAVANINAAVNIKTQVALRISTLSFNFLVLSVWNVASAWPNGRRQLYFRYKPFVIIVLCGSSYVSSRDPAKIPECNDLHKKRNQRLPIFMKSKLLK